MQKKIAKLEQEIEDEAVTLATESMLEADRVRTLERQKKQRIKARALEVVDAYSDEIDKELLEGTKKEINKYGSEEPKKENASKETQSNKKELEEKPKRGRRRKEA